MKGKRKAAPITAPIDSNIPEEKEYKKKPFSYFW
jgi:hypothetical protein